MARIMITDTQGGEHDFSARQSVEDRRYRREDPEGGYLIADHCGMYRVTAVEYKRCDDLAVAEIMGGRTHKDAYKPEIRSGHYGGVDPFELPGCARIENERRVLGGMREASEKYFGVDDDPWSAARL
jgi:hypothetical protein